jgi:hypothetical protein
MARRYQFASIRHPLLCAEASAVRTTWLGSWLRYLLVWVGLVFVLAGWVIVTIAGLVATDSATAIRWARTRRSSSLPGARFWLRVGAALFLAFLYLVWFVVAIEYPFTGAAHLCVPPGFDVRAFAGRSRAGKPRPVRAIVPFAGIHAPESIDRVSRGVVRSPPARGGVSARNVAVCRPATPSLGPLD